MKWFHITEPDNPYSINIAAISFVTKVGTGCRIVTVDGGQHNFLQVSYEEMMSQLRNIESAK